MNSGKIKKIFVPVDFSPHSEISCNYAYDLGVLTGSEVVLFHSFFDQIYFSDGGFVTGFESGVMLTDELILDFFKQKEKKINELAERYNRKLRHDNIHSLKFSCMIESGDPQHLILEACKQSDSGLIIMGSKGMGKKGYLSGSVCERVMNHSDIPVMAVSSGGGFPATRKVLYMTDYELEDVDAIENIRSFFRPVELDIFCLHLNISEHDSDAERKMRSLAEELDKKEIAGNISFHVINCQNPHDLLVSFIKEHGISLIAFIPHKRSLFKSLMHQGITKKDLFLTNIPILSTPF